MPHTSLENHFTTLGLNTFWHAAKTHLRNAITITATATDEATLPIGASKFGGCPDLPPEMTWPHYNGTPMALIAQINFAETYPFDRENRLPNTGILYLFYEAESEPWGYDPEHKNAFFVHYFTGDIRTLERRAKPSHLPEVSDFDAAALHFSQDDNIPSINDNLMQDVELSDEQEIAYGNWLDSQPSLSSKLLGHADILQNEMTVECQFVTHGIYCGDNSDIERRDEQELAAHIAAARDWVLLLQIDSEEGDCGMMWSDSGRLYLWIHKDDLAACRFDKSWLILQCF